MPEAKRPANRKINRKRVNKLIVIFGGILLFFGLVMIPYNLYYWNHNVGCSTAYNLYEVTHLGKENRCWGQEYGWTLDKTRNVLIILGLFLLIGVPILRFLTNRLIKYLYSQD